MAPKLRFAGFCDKWNSSTLSDAGVQIIDGDRGSNYPSSGDFRPMGFCLFLNAGNVTRDGFRFDNVMFITEEKDSELRKGKLQRRDIVLTTRGTIGNTAIYNNQVSFEHIRINSGMVLVRTKQTLTPDFLYLYFNSGYFNSWLNKVAFGSAQPQLTVKLINALSIYFPGKSEQTKIANFLSFVDEKITLLSKQHDLLCQYKKGMMQKIFSQEFRFKDSNGRDFPKWTMRIFSDFFTIGSSKRVLQGDWVNEGVPFYRTRELVSLSKKEKFKSEIFITEGNYSYLKDKYGVPSVGDFLVSGVGTLGIIHHIKNENPFYFKDGNVLWFKKNNEINSDFFYHVFNSPKVITQIVDHAAITTVGTYTIENAKKTKFMCPSLEEQTQIANFLSALDDKIAIKKAELDKLKTWKQGLLQQMFV